MRGRFGLKMALAIVLVPAMAVLAGRNQHPGSAIDPIQWAIAAYQPMWMPPSDELVGVVVSIEAVGGGANDPRQRRHDDQCLWAASHLYHLIRHAGGLSILIRPDDRPASMGPVNGPVWVQVVIRPEPDSEAVGVQDGIAVNFKGNAPVHMVSWPESLQSGTEIPAHRAWGERIYRRLAELIVQRRSELEAALRARNTASRPAADTLHPKLPPDAHLKKSVAVIWPEGDLPTDRATWFCDMYTRLFLSDRTNIYFEPAVTVESGRVVIGGATNQAILQGTLEKVLQAAGVGDVVTQMRLLPEQSNLPTGQWFGVCVAPMALTRGTPTDTGRLQTQLLYGEPVYLLERHEEHYLVQAGDGYWGWVPRSCIRPVSRDEFTAFVQAPQAVLLRDVEQDGVRIVRGARLAVVTGSRGDIDNTRYQAIENQKSKIENGQPVEVMLPDGGKMALSGSDIRLVDELSMVAPRAATALRLLEVPYLFSGRASLGLDCSGLVGTVCDQHGCVLARDAAQQYVVGRLVGTRWYRDALAAGDRVYFLNENGKIVHTGLALGDSHFIHASPPAVQITSLREQDRLYSDCWDRQFLGARRP